MIFLIFFNNLVVFCGVLKPNGAGTGIEIFNEYGEEILPIEINRTPFSMFFSSSTASSITSSTTWSITESTFVCYFAHGGDFVQQPCPDNYTIPVTTTTSWTFEPTPQPSEPFLVVNKCYSVNDYGGLVEQPCHDNQTVVHTPPVDSFSTIENHDFADYVPVKICNFTFETTSCYITYVNYPLKTEPNEFSSTQQNEYVVKAFQYSEEPSPNSTSDAGTSARNTASSTYDSESSTTLSRQSAKDNGIKQSVISKYIFSIIIYILI